MKKKSNKIEYTDDNSDIVEEKFRKLRHVLKTCKTERQEYLTGWQRERADHQNYIKQKSAEIQDFRKFAAEDIIAHILPVLDNLALACDSTPENLKDEAWVRGILNIRKHFVGILRDQGVEEIDAKIGSEFDPVYHEAIGQIASEEKSGAIAQILQRGYTIHGKVIRPTRIKISK